MKAPVEGELEPPWNPEIGGLHNAPRMIRDARYAAPVRTCRGTRDRVPSDQPSRSLRPESSHAFEGAGGADRPRVNRPGGGGHLPGASRGRDRRCRSSTTRAILAGGYPAEMPRDAGIELLKEYWDLLLCGPPRGSRRNTRPTPESGALTCETAEREAHVRPDLIACRPRAAARAPAGREPDPLRPQRPHALRGAGGADRRLDPRVRLHQPGAGRWRRTASSPATAGCWRRASSASTQVPVIELAHLTRGAEAGLHPRRQQARRARRLGPRAAGARGGGARELGVDLGSLGFEAGEIDALLHAGAPDPREEETPGAAGRSRSRARRPLAARARIGCSAATPPIPPTSRGCSAASAAPDGHRPALWRRATTRPGATRAGVGRRPTAPARC